MFHGLRQNFTVSLAARCSEEEKKDYLWLIPAGVCALPRGKGYNEEDYWDRDRDLWERDHRLVPGSENFWTDSFLRSTHFPIWRQQPAGATAGRKFSPDSILEIRVSQNLSKLGGGKGP